jgi:hypothetical protein
MWGNFLTVFKMTIFKKTNFKGCSNPGRQVSASTKFCAVAPNICESSIRNLLF